MKYILPIFITFLTSIFNPINGCTIFSVKDDSNCFIGSNYDLSKDAVNKFGDMYLWTSPSKQNKYGAIYLSFQPGNCSATSGLNEKGLYYDWADLTESATKPFDKNKPTYYGFMPYKIMEECSTTDQAIEIVKKYNWGIKTQGGHMLIADSAGNSAVFEWLDGELVILKGDKNQVITNTPIAYCGNNYKNCWRLEKAHKMLDNHSISKNYLKETLKSVAQNDFAKTLLSRIIDLKKKEITIYYKRDFDYPVVINLDDELKRGLRYYCIPSLFNENNTNCTLTKQFEFYYDENWNEIPTKKKAMFYRKITKDSTSSDYIVKDYYLKSNKIQYEARFQNYESVILKQQNGTAVWYYENGNKSSEGSFVDNKRNGKWRYWSKDGKLMNEEIYVDYVIENETSLNKDDKNK